MTARGFGRHLNPNVFCSCDASDHVEGGVACGFVPVGGASVQDLGLCLGAPGRWVAVSALTAGAGGWWIMEPGNTGLFHTLSDES